MPDDDLSSRAFTLGDFFIMDNGNSDTPIIDAKTYSNSWMLRRWYDLQNWGSYDDLDVAKISATPSLNQIQKLFSGKTNATNPIPLKYYHISGHDDNMTAHLRLIGFSNSTCVVDSILNNTDVSTDLCPSTPPTASNLIWELINDTAKGYIVKTSYNGQYLDYCKKNQKDARGEFFCTLDEFNNVVNTEYTKSWDEYCENPVADGKLGFDFVSIILIIAIVVSMIVIGVLGFRLHGLNKKLQKQVSLNFDFQINF
jgi:hypothetical protein